MLALSTFIELLVQWEDGRKASKQVETVLEKGGSICERELPWFGEAGRAEKWWGEGKKVSSHTWKIPESSRNVGYPSMVTRPTGPELKGACHTYEQFSSVRSRAKLERVRQNARLQCRVSTQDFIKRESSGYI